MAPRKVRSFVLGLGAVMLLASLVAALLRRPSRGTFVNARDEREQLELRPHGRFVLQELGVQRSGRYVVQDSVIVLQSDAGDLSTARIRGDTLIDHHEDKWIRR